jgi:5-methylcytosine-specific restriction protein A
MPGAGLCRDCRRQRREDRKWVYGTKRWKNLREQLLSEQPVCQQCGAAQPSEVDHIEPLVDHPELAFERSNLQMLCRTCHGIKTRNEQGLGF